MYFSTLPVLLFSIMATAPFVTSSPAAPSATPSNGLSFHDAEGNQVNQRPYTPEELDLLNNATLTPRSTNLTPRSTRDVLYWRFWYLSCGSRCSTPEHIKFARTGQRSCTSPDITEEWSGQNACFRSGVLGSDWYFVDNCDQALDWGSVKAGAFVGNLRTWENRYVGPCFATGHAKDTAGCKGYDSVEWTSLVRCTVP
ncbi:hypothetical protein CC86DRAFT_465600 [Ophiobolus disseminans]|uniref:Uncharacterized protein n=1 Tax=Ophiobolus disseminans TaxID=1469910 RepID=A0A6A7A6I8_9PLEO|nr:hypothetical protein CC86DRAFT_465600 [Ophiobolus disseminans]